MSESVSPGFWHMEELEFSKKDFVIVVAVVETVDRNVDPRHCAENVPKHLWGQCGQAGDESNTVAIGLAWVRARCVLYVGLSKVSVDRCLDIHRLSTAGERGTCGTSFGDTSQPVSPVIHRLIHRVYPHLCANWGKTSSVCQM